MIAKEFERFLLAQEETFLTPAKNLAVLIDNHNVDHAVLLLSQISSVSYTHLYYEKQGFTNEGLSESQYAGEVWYNLVWENEKDVYKRQELIITEPQVKVVESAVYLFRNGVFYHLTPQQRTLWKAIQDLPMDQDRKKRLHFDPTDQTKLSYSLKEFKKLGQITAPKSFLIHDFTPEFHFDLAQDQTVLLDVVFQYQDRVAVSYTHLSTEYFKI